MRIGTRGSALALWQARTVARLIRETGGPDCEIVVIRTAGDERPGPPDPPLPPSAAGASLAAPPDGTVNIKRAFVKEIETALSNGEIDAAVHSAKDLPGELPEDLVIAAALAREMPNDALLLPRSAAVSGLDAVRRALGDEPRLGTSSVRRMAELRRTFPRASFVSIRGNVDTRLRKLDEGACDALVLAVAGVRRLGLEERISAILPPEVCLPAPGQGIVAVEIARGCSEHVRRAVARISDADAEAALLTERAVMQALGGGCQMPLGALASVDEHMVSVDGIVASLDGTMVVRSTARGNRGRAAAVGEKLAADLLAKGAAQILERR